MSTDGAPEPEPVVADPPSPEPTPEPDPEPEPGYDAHAETGIMGLAAQIKPDKAKHLERFRNDHAFLESALEAMELASTRHQDSDVIAELKEKLGEDEFNALLAGQPKTQNSDAFSSAAEYELALERVQNNTASADEARRVKATQKAFFDRMFSSPKPDTELTQRLSKLEEDLKTSQARAAQEKATSEWNAVVAQHESELFQEDKQTPTDFGKAVGKEIDALVREVGADRNSPATLRKAIAIAKALQPPAAAPTPRRHVPSPATEPSGDAEARVAALPLSAGLRQLQAARTGEPIP